MTVVARSPHTAALLDALTDRQLLPVGDGEAPDDGGWQGAPGQSDFVAYLVLHMLTGGSTDGSLGDPQCDAAIAFQVTAVGYTREQCEDAAGSARDALYESPIDVDGRGAEHVRDDGWGGARRDDTVDPSLFISTERYRFITNAGTPVGS